MGNGDHDQDDEEPGAGEYRVGQGRLNERHPASWKLWLQDLALDSLRRARGLLGDGLALLCFPMSVRKEVYEEPRGHRQLVGPE